TLQTYSPSLHDALPISFRKKMRANEFARIAEMPSVFTATGACSRLEPQPKLAPATIMSPGRTFFAQVGSTASNACSANTFGSVRSEEHTSELQSRVDLV